MQPFADLKISIFPASAEKSPAIAGGFKSATICDPGPDWQLIGIPISEGIIVIDVDTYKGQTTDRIEQVLGCNLDWSSALIQHTRSGGAHYAFRCDSVDALRHGSDLFCEQIGAGFDTRCAGRGYICTGVGYTTVALYMLSPMMQYMLPELPAAAVAALTALAPIDPPPPVPPTAAVSMSELRSALAALPDEYATDRQQWFEIGCGIKSALGDAGWPLFDEFSKRCADKYDERKNYRQWQGIKPQRTHGANIGADTIYYYARLNGWAGDPAAIGFGQALHMLPHAPQATWATPVNLSDVMTVAVPPRFVTADILPAGTTTLLGAHGGTGKSQLALQWAVAVALGGWFMGRPTEQQRVLFYSAEDGADVLRWRLRKICKQQNIDPSALAEQLILLDASEMDATLYRDDPRTRIAGTTPNFDRLTEEALQRRAGLIIVDNASDVFAANENERHAVRGFMRSLNQLAKRTNAAVLLLSHVDKATAKGAAAGAEGYSGSTAWHNSARSRLFLSEREGNLELQHQKSNYGQRADPIRMAFDGDGVLVLSFPGFGASVVPAQHTDDMFAVLNLVREFTERGESIPTAPTANGNARRLLSGQPTFPARWRTGHGLFDCLRDAERQGLIHRVTYRSRDRKERERWQVSDQFFACASIAPAPLPHQASTANAHLRPHGLGIYKGAQRAHLEVGQAAINRTAQQDDAGAIAGGGIE